VQRRTGIGHDIDEFRSNGFKRRGMTLELSKNAVDAGESFFGMITFNHCENDNRPTPDETLFNSEQAAHFLVGYCSPVPNKPVNPEWRRTPEEAEAVFRARQALVDAFAEPRKRSEAAWNAAGVRMRMAWVRGRDAART
jgi:hypothetical protein